MFAGTFFQFKKNGFKKYFLVSQPTRISDRDRQNPQNLNVLGVKGVKTMENIDFDTLSSAFGDLARGFKKLKAVCEWYRNQNSRNVPGVPQSHPEGMEVDSGILVPISEEEKSWEPTLDAAEFLCSKKFLWGNNIIHNLLSIVMGEHVRADRFHNQWIVSSGKKGWRKISEPQMEKLYKYCVGVLNESREIVRAFPNREDFNDVMGIELHRGKWKRAKYIFGIDLPYAQFLKYCRDVHDSLPSFR